MAEQVQSDKIARHAEDASLAANIMILAPVITIFGTLLPWVTVRAPFAEADIVGTETLIGRMLIVLCLLTLPFAAAAAVRQWRICYLVAAAGALGATMISLVQLVSASEVGRELRPSGFMSAKAAYGLVISVVGSFTSGVSTFVAARDRDSK